MTDKKIERVADAAEHGRRKGQQTRAELLEDNRALQLIISEQSESITSLKASREAWVRKCEELTGEIEDTNKAISLLLQENSNLQIRYNEVIAYPSKNLWRHLKEMVGLGG